MQTKQETVKLTASIYDYFQNHHMGNQPLRKNVNINFMNISINNILVIFMLHRL